MIYVISYTYFENGYEEDNHIDEIMYFNTMKEAVKKLSTLQDSYLFNAVLARYQKNNLDSMEILAEITETEEKFYNKRIENLFYREWIKWKRNTLKILKK